MGGIVEKNPVSFEEMEETPVATSENLDEVINEEVDEL